MRIQLLVFVWVVVGWVHARALGQEGEASVLLRAMEAELERSFERLRSAGEEPLYFLAYRVYETEWVGTAASYGAIQAVTRGGRGRELDVEARVGSPELDSTHKIRAGGFGFGDFDFGGPSLMPVEDDEASIRTALWLATDAAFKSAQRRFTRVKANKAVKVEEEDPSDDFSAEEPSVYRGEISPLEVDRKAWEDRLRRVSRIYRDHPAIQDSDFSFSAARTRRCLVTSEGTRIEDERVQYRVGTTVRTVADDGMELWLYDAVETTDPEELPTEVELEAMGRRLARSIDELRQAPLAEPYVGPAILRARAAAVFFHEVFGHRVEGHRQKDEEEGRTFAKKVGEKVMPEFITVVDDPNRERLGSRTLNGAYRYDDEGVRAQRVVLVDKGVLKGFLMGRSPVQGFPRSNGHGRCSPGRTPVARQGNLIVESSKTVAFEELRAMLLEEVRRQGKPYGLIFDDIAGGFTMTQTYAPQAFKVLPLRVVRVHADGRPDELIRGVDIVGTPLASLERILAASDDVDVFNGTCGAESGWVPVSAASPSLLVGTIEVERRQKEQERPPLLPPPLHDPEGSEKEGGQ